MMGIIVNAGSVLKYVSMVLLVFVYMHDCYNNVYENYLTFNKTIIDDMIDRTTDDLRKIASMSSKEQANAAFLVRHSVFSSHYHPTHTPTPSRCCCFVVVVVHVPQRASQRCFPGAPQHHLSLPSSP